MTSTGNSIKSFFARGLKLKHLKSIINLILQAISLAVLFTVGVSFAASTCQADDTSLGTYRAQLRRLSDSQALNSRDFNNRPQAYHLPGHQSSFNPMTELCLHGQTIQTVRKRNACYQWSARDPRDGRTYVFETQSSAQAMAELNPGNQNARCIAESYDHGAAPIHQSYIGCRSHWVVNFRNSNSQETFHDKQQALRYIRQNSGSVEPEPVCSSIGEVQQNLTTQVRVTFYTKSRNNPRIVNTRQIGIRQCSQFVNGVHVDIVTTGGELSGGSSE